MRPVVQAECTLKESAAINQILGRRVSNIFMIFRMKVVMMRRMMKVVVVIKMMMMRMVRVRMVRVVWMLGIRMSNEEDDTGEDEDD